MTEWKEYKIEQFSFPSCGWHLLMSRWSYHFWVSTFLQFLKLLVPQYVCAVTKFISEAFFLFNFLSFLFIYSKHQLKLKLISYEKVQYPARGKYVIYATRTASKQAKKKNNNNNKQTIK